MSVRTDTVNLNININNNKAQQDLNNLKKRAADLKFEMQGLVKGTAEYIAKGDELKKVNAEMAELKKTIGLTSLTQKELVAELRRLNALKGSVAPFSKEFKDLDGQIKAVTNRLYDVKNGVQGFSSFFSKIKDEVKQFGVLAAGYLGFQFITGQFQNIIRGAGTLSDQLADLRRVAGLTADEAKVLNTELSKIDTRTSVAGLRDIAIIAGKLGVAKEDVLGFTKAVDQLVVALGDELGDADQITSQLGKILNVFDGKVNGDNITRLGNAFVELANTGAATGGFIADFDQRLSGIAKSAGIGLGSLSGLGAGLEEMGGRVESSATAVQKLINSIAGDLPKAAQIAGVSTEAFTKLFKEDATEALLRYSEGLVKNKDSFSEIVAEFKNAGEEGARTIETISKLGSSADYLRGRIDLGKKSILESNAITEAFTLKNETFGATLDKLSKQFNALVASPGVRGFLQSAIEGASKFISVINEIPAGLLKFTLALGTLLVGIALFNSGMIQSARLSLIQAARTAAVTIASYAYATAITVSRLATSAMIATQAAYITIVTLLRNGITLATAAQRLWNIAVATGLGPIGLLVVAVGAIAGAVGALSAAFKSSSREMGFHTETLRIANEEIAKQKSQIDTLTQVVKDNSISLDNRKKALDDLIKISPEYLSRLTLENIATSEGKDILDRYNLALENSANLKAAAIIKDREFEKGLKLRTVRQELEIAQKSGAGFGDLTDEAQAAFSKIKTSVGRTAFTSDLFNVVPSKEDFQEAFIEIDGLLQKQKENTNAATQNFVDKTKKQQEARQQFLLHEITVLRTEQNALDKNSDAYQVATKKYADAVKKYQDEFGFKTITSNVKATSTATKESIGLIKELQDKIAELDKNRPGLKTEKDISANIAERKKLQAELDRLEGRQPGAKKNESDYARLLKEAQEFQKKLREIQERRDAGENIQQEEIIKIQQKYQQLLDKAQKYYDQHIIDLNTFNEDERIINEAALKELNDLRKKFYDEGATKNYEAAIAGQRDFTEQLKSQYAAQFTDGLISREEYDAAITAADKNLLINLIADAEQWARFSKKAAEDVKNFKAQQDKQTTDDSIKQRDARIALDKEEAAAKIRLAVTTSRPGSTANFKAQRAALKFEEEEAVKAEKAKWQRIGVIVDESSAVIQTIRADYRKKDEELEQDHIDAMIDKITGWANFAIDQLRGLNNILNNIEDAKLAKEKKQSDEKAKLYKNQLDKKLLSQAQYDKKIQQLREADEQKSIELRRKQAKREKALNLFSAIVNIAGGVAKALNNPYPLNIVLAAITAAAGAIQIGAIASQPLPTAGKGRLLKGDKHSDRSGGIHILAEDGEAIINRRNMADNTRMTVTGNTRQITSFLNSRNGNGVNWAGGAKVVSMTPWLSRRPASINPMMPKVMAAGGLVTNITTFNPSTEPLEAKQAVNKGAAGNERTEALLVELINAQHATNESINSFSGRIRVSYKDIEKTKQLYGDAKKASGFSQ